MTNKMHYIMIPASEKGGNGFVGLRIKDNTIEFHYPETYLLSDDDKKRRRDIISILRTLRLTNTSNTKSEYNTAYDIAPDFPLSAYLWIINDHLKYGRYENRKKTSVYDPYGKINWKKTMRTDPIISCGNIIYPKIIVERDLHKDSIITEIYNFCVQKAMDSIGWLYGLSFDSKGIDYYRLYNKRRYLYVINSELCHAYSDMVRCRLQQMKNIITGLDEELASTKELTYGVNSYENVFEAMVDMLFSTVDDIRKYYPYAWYDLQVDHNTHLTAPLRPDTIMIKGRTAYILDAKYYRYGITFDAADLPETTSIQKQITYGDHIKKNMTETIDNVYNAFVLPYSKTDNAYKDKLNRDIEYIGYAGAEWSKSDIHSKIAVILIDTTYLIQHWSNHDNDISYDLSREIEHNIGR